ncbi:F-box only protein 8-like [Bidens hawaiensis]|uniref:F-box only protein 8-like n=1 Tax=Bidens hawaiensis TaxID=980011 RepID=UPI004049A826
MSRLPVKSLIQFQSVSKTWKSVIDSPDFIIKHYNCQLKHTQVQHLVVTYADRLVTYSGQVDYEQKYVPFVDDEQKVSLTLYQLVEMLLCSRIIGSYHEFLGLYSRSCRNTLNMDVVVLWNPSIRKAVAVVVPNIGNWRYETALPLGFWFCRETNDLKIVKINYANLFGMGSNPLEVEVFTFSTGTWRRSYGNLPRKSIHFVLHKEVVLDGVYNWLANERITADELRYMIISFDMTSEEFTELILPHSLKPEFMSKLGESLVVVGRDKHAISSDYDVWVMGDGVPKSFTKLFTFTPKEDHMTLMFWKCGEFIIDIPKQGDDQVQLVVYEFYPRGFVNLGIDGLENSLYVCHYMETLLLDQPGLRIYSDNRGWRAKKKDF